MSDKPRFSITSSIGLKGVAAPSAHLKRMFQEPSPSSLSKYVFP